MMALNSTGSDSAAPNRTGLSNNKNQSAYRRRRSKGTIAAFTFGKSGEGSTGSGGVGGKSDAREGGNSPPDQSSGTVSGSSANAGLQPQHADPSSPSNPCHVARLTLMCCQNSIRMGARTQLGLCPPGRARRGLKAALRKKVSKGTHTRSRSSQMQNPLDIGYFGIEKMLGSETLMEYPVMEEDFLVSTNTFDAESDEEASSGDEDDLNDLDALMQEDSHVLDDEKKYDTLNEPLFTPIGTESPMTSGPGVAMGGGIGAGRLPFNRRKLRYFDSISSSDALSARQYLNTELRRSKKREMAALAKHLKKAQRKERRRIKEERGIPLTADDLNDKENDSNNSDSAANVSKFEQAMVPSTAAALLLESLSLNPLESVEGMAKCYDGIVAAGTALLESTMNDPTSPSNEKRRREEIRADILTALSPLLIIYLEQPSGEVILSLARLRRMCGTARYQRRFVQRVAPALIRPPNGAMWCLRHQNDMEPILAAAELIFDSATQIFSKGWYDRGQLLLADSKRAETLNAAAMQLKNLKTGPGDSLSLGSSIGGHSGWRTSRIQREGTKGSNDSLAEWEVIAVDRQIRVSISNIMSTNWSKPNIQNRDMELARSYHRTARANTWRSHQSTAHSTTGGETSPIHTASHSPARSPVIKTASSPMTLAPEKQLPTLERNDNPFTPSTTAQETNEVRSRSPIPPPPPPASIHHPPLSPTPPNRSSSAEIENRITSDAFSVPMATTRSLAPKSPKRVDIEVSPTVSAVPSPSSPGLPAPPSSKDSISGPPMSSPGRPQQKGITPISPSSVGTASSRFMSSVSTPSNSSLTGSTGTQSAHYRMLSSYAERKRTVAACRALRAQLNSFQKAFETLHGRPPKTAADRAPLATTYSQYREWKKAIRTDAACRIQALSRGAILRRRLLRENDPRLTRIILAKMGRTALQPIVSQNVINELSIPAEIGQPLSKGTDFAQTVDVGSIGPDGFPTQGTSVQPLAPQWSNQVLRRRSGERSDGFSSPSSVPRPIASPSGGSSVSSGGSGDFSRLPLPELQARKRDLKQQLKQYDMSFYKENGRMPVKAEKEPIRHLYERYNSLKSLITSMERDSGRAASSSPVAAQQSSAAGLSQRTISPVPNSTGEDGHSVARQPRYNSRAPPASPGPSPAVSQDLTALTEEKQKLHQMLRAYEKDFFREHKRQVSNFMDISPVADNYRRYKEIKKAIAALVKNGER